MTAVTRSPLRHWPRKLAPLTSRGRVLQTGTGYPVLSGSRRCKRSFSSSKRLSIPANSSFMMSPFEDVLQGPEPAHFPVLLFHLNFSLNLRPQNHTAGLQQNAIHHWPSTAPIFRSAFIHSNSAGSQSAPRYYDNTHSPKSQPSRR